MEPFRSHPGSQTALFLAGCILSCFLQLVPAQENLTVVSVPEHPIQGQSIILNVKENVREAVVQCEWTLPSGDKIIFARDTKLTLVNDSQDVVLHQNCSLTIKNMKLTDQGGYIVKVTVPSTKQQQTRGQEIYIGSIFLNFCDEKQIRINVQPQSPVVGQHVVMTPQGIPGKYDHCHWNKITESGGSEKFIESKQEPNKQQNQKQKITQSCSFHLTQLTLADSGNYSIRVEVFSDQRSTKEKENRDQMKCYRSQTQLIVKSGSTPVKNSVGIIAGALLGSLTWTSTLSLVPLLFGLLSPFFPEC